MEQIAKNKKAYWDYEIKETYTAGIVLVGSEVKSIRNKDVSIKEAYCHVIDGEVWIENMHISQFKESGIYQNHEPLRRKKLLLNKKEITKLTEKVSRKGLTLIPLKLILTTKGLIKVDIGLGVGKKNYDKRLALKEKDNKRESSRNINQ